MVDPQEPDNVFSMLAGADSAAAAALRELPEALVIVFDHELRFVLTAGQAIERAGEDVCGTGGSVQAAFPQELWSTMEPLFRSALEGETRSREIWTADEQHCLMVDVGPLTISGGVATGSQDVAGGVAVVLDITARRQADLLSGTHSGSGFEEVFEQAPIGTGLLDLDGRWLMVNRALCDITGYTSGELVGKRFEGIMHPEDAFNDAAQREQLMAGAIPAFQVEKRYFDASGETVAAILSMSLVRDRTGAALHFIAQLQDISERKLMEEHLRRLADHDGATGLRNRRLFEHDLRMQVARSQRYGELAGLILIDLNGFADVNATYGRKVGDETLRAVARALSRRLRETDLIARLGGDEFAVLLPHIDEEGLSVVAEGIARVIPACTIDVGAGVMHPTASVGFATIDESTEGADAVLQAAGRALQLARRSAG